MFRGATKVTIDAKGRLAIPTRYRDRLTTRSNGQLLHETSYLINIIDFNDSKNHNLPLFSTYLHYILDK